MHSWVFRHRERLRVVFGLPEPTSPLPSTEERTEEPRRKCKFAPGTLHRTTRYVVLSPMTPAPRGLKL